MKETNNMGWWSKWKAKYLEIYAVNKQILNARLNVDAIEKEDMEKKIAELNAKLKEGT